MTQAWHQLVDTIRLLPPNRGEDDRRSVVQEKQTLDTALEHLSVLIDLRRTGGTRATTPRVSPAPGTEGVLTPPSGSGGGGHGPGSGPGGPGGLKRKRRPSGGISASPAPVIPPAPHTGGSESALSSVASPLGGGGGGPRSGTPLRDAATAKRRAAANATAAGQGDTTDQLPLRAGRKVAVRQKQAGGVKGDDEEWILAKVVKMVGGDKTRYEVQDADDGTRWTTTLKNIILLPDPEAAPSVSSHPSNLQDFARGTQVLALYPDTTSFYRATVVSAPIPGTGMGGGVKGGSNGRPDPGAKSGTYRLSFVDDGDNVHDVSKLMVVQANAGKKSA